MSKIKIARISTGVLDQNEGLFPDLCVYKFDTFAWFEFDKAVELYEGLRYSDFKSSEDSDSNEDELELMLFLEDGVRPYAYLFSFEIDKKVWDNREKLALKDGFDDSDEWLNYVVTDFDWKFEREKEIEIPTELSSFYNKFKFIQENKSKIQEKFMQFVGETGNPDNLTQMDFEMFIAENARDLICPKLN
jgi:hypothetical protein